MRSKAIALALCLLSLCALSLWSTRAQEGGLRQLIVPLAEGGYVAFKAETVAPDANEISKTSSTARQTQGVLDSQALVDHNQDHNQIIHRVLVDTEGQSSVTIFRFLRIPRLNNSKWQPGPSTRILRASCWREAPPDSKRCQPR